MDDWDVVVALFFGVAIGLFYSFSWDTQSILDARLARWFSVEVLSIQLYCSTGIPF
jgi:hypothetical protein